MRRHLRPIEDGQTLVFTVITLVVLLSFCALVIEGGNAFLQRRQMQGVADAAAMAGAQQVGTSRTDAEATARDYVSNKNSIAGADVNSITSTASGMSSCNGVSMPPYSICVRVKRVNDPLFGSLLGGTTVGAQAIGAVSMVRSLPGWLPFGLMEKKYTSGTQIDFKPGSTNSIMGSINPPASDSCKFYGGNNVREVIMSKKFGGVDACAIDIGNDIETQTGVTSGPLTSGFDDRLSTNTDSFDDVFALDPSTGRYAIKKPDSPRLGIIPLAAGTGNWPLTGGQEMSVTGYVFVYIGDQTKSPNYPPLTGNGSGLTIHLTPVDALLPTNWDAQFVAFDPNAHDIVAYRLVS